MAPSYQARDEVGVELELGVSPDGEDDLLQRIKDLLIPSRPSLLKDGLDLGILQGQQFLVHEGGTSQGKDRRSEVLQAKVLRRDRHEGRALIFTQLQLVIGIVDHLVALPAAP